MKKLSALLVTFIMLWICSSSYGYFLVYTLSGTIRGTEGAIVDVDINNVSISFKGYLAMDFNDGTDSLMDANLIIYGKDPNNHKVYVQLNASDSNEFLDPNIWYRNVKNFYVLNGESPFNFRIVIMGNVKSTNIGLAVNKNIASSLKGGFTGIDGMFLEVDQSITGIAKNVSATLDTSLTKTVNNPSDPWTQDEVVNELKNILAGKLYAPVSIPKPK